MNYFSEALQQKYGSEGVTIQVLNDLQYGLADTENTAHSFDHKETVHFLAHEGVWSLQHKTLHHFKSIHFRSSIYIPRALGIGPAS